MGSPILIVSLQVYKSCAGGEGEGEEVLDPSMLFEKLNSLRDSIFFLSDICALRIIPSLDTNIWPCLELF